MAQSNRPHMVQQSQVPQRDIDRLLDTGCQAPKAKLAFGILAYCGCRVSQLPGLSVEDIQLATNTIIFRGTNNRKTGQTYEISIHPKLKLIFETHLPADGLLFPDWDNGQACLIELRMLLRKACNQAGLQLFSVHVFRKTVLINAMNDFLNHSESMSDEAFPLYLDAPLIELIQYYGIRCSELLALDLSSLKEDISRKCCHSCTFYKHDAHSFLTCAPHPLGPGDEECSDFIPEK